MKHFFFYEYNTGEEFLVGADTLAEAKRVAEDVARHIANNYGEDDFDVRYGYEMSDWEAEVSGLDEY